MGKRRTRKAKQEARHQFLYTWESEPKNVRSEANVKRQLKNPIEAIKSGPRSSNMANNLAQVYDLASVKRDIGKSLIIASLILGAELVIYLAWF